MKMNHLFWRGLSPKFNTISTFEWFELFLFFRNCHFLIIFMSNSKCWPTRPKLPWCVMLPIIWTWSWVLLHIFLHPFRELSLVSEPKTYSFSTVWLETRIHIVTGLTNILRSMGKSIWLWHTVDMNWVLKGGRTLFLENS